LNLRNARHAENTGPLDLQCRCPACCEFSRAYLHHVVKANEIIASMLLTWHNLTYYQDLMAGLRKAIAEESVQDFAANCARMWTAETETLPD
jgi:queuine tRNA-ribosyltransferase